MALRSGFLSGFSTREGELDIFFKSANPGLKRIDEEKKAPSSKPLKTLDVGRRAKAKGSAALKSARSGNIASLLFVNDASLDEFLAVNTGCHLAGYCTTPNEKRDCSNGDNVVGALIGIMADQYRDHSL